MARRARAFIIRDDEVLLMNRVKQDEIYWVFPGGALEDGESPAQALQRECMEELGVRIEVGDHIFSHVSEKPEIKGDIEDFYLARIIGGEIGTGTGPEFSPRHGKGAYKPTWARFRDLASLDVRPVQALPYLTKAMRPEPNTFVDK